ncbi:putative bifunctional diguanylate cyclase/phosphodiesterase [Noviherbaspirillum galbum]|uniref:EAL domain-containing protein n=1 Tax=Noviherbaspirillum galbum TaxID=2709383 RepID=A0A6B3SFH5_9BURK|nr:EAL domain-containing protein [Noviherbaspirillum galbum]NEX59647.1 EAL domain-containing protein [Noviherbaspirillum galbum]
MRLRSLESRIVILFLVLILAVQLAAFLSIRSAIDVNGRAAVRNELAVSEKVFSRLVDQYAQNLTQGARLLANEYGFKTAISTNDRETIESALANHGDRIEASHTVLFNLDHKVSASTTSLQADVEASLKRMVLKAEQSGTTTGIAIFGTQPYQIVVVPVRAPVTIGWVAMAFPIDKRLAKDMRDLSSMQVSIFTTRGGAWMPDESTLSPDESAALGARLQELNAQPGFMPQLQVGGNDYSARLIELAQSGDARVIAVMQRSISEAVAPYRRLQLILLILTAVGVIIAIGGSIFIAKRITGPLKKLGETARRLGAGDYQGDIDVTRDDEIGELSKTFASMRDDIANREIEVRRLAYWDTLTDLPNRAQFAYLLQGAIEQADGGGSCFVLMMDLDRFKNVNDIMGHAFGDALLRQVAQRLQQQVAAPARIARLGGDEFAILLPGATLEDATGLAARLLKTLEQPIALEDQNVDLGAGIGIAGYPEHARDVQSLLSRVEVAMYAAKNGGSGAVVYDPDIDKASQQSLSLLSELRHAAEQNEFRLFVQPKVDLASGVVSGMEALVRWVHPERGMVFPDNFIPFAEKTGFIRVITQWVMEKAAATASELARQGLRMRVSVNLSTRDLMDQELPQKFAAVLARHQLTPAAFCLEITESAIMDDPVRAQHTLESLHAMGVALSIDDFGTGYSSLAYLKRLPVQELKIDKSFVLKMERDAGDAKIVRSTIDLGHNLGLKVVAEGIESQAAWDMLAAMGCDQGQGYFMSKPMPAEDFAGWLARWTPPLKQSAAAREVA